MALCVAEGFDDIGALADLNNKEYFNSWYMAAAQGGVTNANVSRYSDGRQTAWGNYSYVNWKTRGTPTQTVFFHCAYKRETGDAGSRNVVQFRDQSGPTVQCSVFMEGANGDLKVYRSHSGGVQLGSTVSNVFALGTWYWVSVRAKIDNSAGEVDVYINGSLVFSISGVDTQSSANAYCDDVFIDQGTGADCNIDDVVVCDTNGSAPFNGLLLAERRIVTRMANADGNSTDWTASAGSDYQCVDENGPNNDTDYISSATVGQKTLVGFADGPASPNIEAVWPSIRARKDDTTTREIRDVLRTASTNYNGITRALTTTYTNYCGTLRETNPNSGVAWTESEFNAAEAGPEVVT